MLLALAGQVSNSLLVFDMPLLEAGKLLLKVFNLDLVFGVALLEPSELLLKGFKLLMVGLMAAVLARKPLLETRDLCA